MFNLIELQKSSFFLSPKLRLKEVFMQTLYSLIYVCMYVCMYMCVCIVLVDKEGQSISPEWKKVGVLSYRIDTFRKPLA